MLHRCVLSPHHLLGSPAGRGQVDSSLCALCVCVCGEGQGPKACRSWLTWLRAHSLPLLHSCPGHRAQAPSSLTLPVSQVAGPEPTAPCRAVWDQGHGSARLRPGCPRGDRFSPTWAWRWQVPHHCCKPGSQAQAVSPPRQGRETGTPGGSSTQQWEAGKAAPWAEARAAVWWGARPLPHTQGGIHLPPGTPCFWPLRTDGGGQ